MQLFLFKGEYRPKRTGHDMLCVATGSVLSKAPPQMNPVSSPRVSGIGVRVYGIGFRLPGLGNRVQVLGNRI